MRSVCSVPESTGTERLNDIQRMCGSFEPPEMGRRAVITGTVPRL